MISKAVKAYLASQSGVTNIVSTRIYPIILPQKPTFPAITYREVDHDIDETFDGQTSLTDSYYMIDAWANTYNAVCALGDAIRAAMKNTSGSFGTINIDKCIVSSAPVTVYEDSVEKYRQTQTFLIRHAEV